MFALVGFAVGYVVGVQQGKEGMAKLISSWQEIQASEDFAAAIETGKAMMTGLLKQAIEAGSGVMAGEMKNVVGRALKAA
jgi:hypothetical protein